MDSTTRTLPSLPQSQLYRDALRLMGRNIERIGETPACPASGLVLKRPFGPLGEVGLVPGGLRWSGGPNADAVKSLLTRISTPWTIVNCVTRDERAAFRQAGALPLISERFDARIDLTADRQARLDGMHQKWRNRLRHAQTAGLRLRHAPFCETRESWFLEAEAVQRRRRGYKALPLSFVQAVARQAPEATRLFVAEEGGSPSAAMLFLRHEGAATYHIGVTTEAGRHQSAHALLLWEACNWLAGRGDRRLDLGLLETQDNPGLARFKLGSGAVPVSLGETYLYAAILRPLAGLAALISPRSVSRAAAGQTGRSCR